MSEQRSRETRDEPMQLQPPDAVRREERPRPEDEFKSYSLELLAVLEG